MAFILARFADELQQTLSENIIKLQTFKQIAEAMYCSGQQR